MYFREGNRGVLLLALFAQFHSFSVDRNKMRDRRTDGPTKPLLESWLMTKNEIKLHVVSRIWETCYFLISLEPRAFSILIPIFHVLKSIWLTYHAVSHLEMKVRMLSQEVKLNETLHFRRLTAVSRLTGIVCVVSMQLDFIFSRVSATL